MFLLHIWFHFCVDVATESEIHYSVIEKRLESVNFVPCSGYEEDVFLAIGRDDEEIDDNYICIRSIESLFNWAHKMLPVLTGVKQNDVIRPDDALRCFFDCLASVNEVYTCFFSLLLLFTVSDYCWPAHFQRNIYGCCSNLSGTDPLDQQPASHPNTLHLSVERTTRLLSLFLLELSRESTPSLYL